MIETILLIGAAWLTLVFVVPAMIYAARTAYLTATFEFFKDHCVQCNQQEKEQDNG